MVANIGEILDPEEEEEGDNVGSGFASKKVSSGGKKEESK
jgi:hypothetical protein